MRGRGEIQAKLAGILLLLAAMGGSLQNASAADGVTTVPAPIFQNGNDLPQPNADSDPSVRRFLDFYNPRLSKPLPGNLTAKDIIPFPSDQTDNVAPVPERHAFVTASVCTDCHDATVVKSDAQPSMAFADANRKLLANWSMVGEWRGTLMGHAGRDPVFQAQVETERTHNPVIAPAVDNICFSCHASMGQRQIAEDTGKKILFSNCMMYSTQAGGNPHPSECGDLSGPHYAKYGMLGRDGISCAMCHSIGPANGQWREAGGAFRWEIFYGAQDPTIPSRESPPGPPYPFTSNFQYNTDKLYVPDAGIDKSQRPMQMLGLADVERSAPLKDSSLCGSCHVVIVPKVSAAYAPGGQVPGKPGKVYTSDPLSDPNMGLAYEQTTFLEWMNSAYGFNAPSGKNVQCQGCHMPGVHVAGSGHPGKIDVVNLGPQWGVPYRPQQYTRHDFVGANLFATEMFAQFAGILGITLGDAKVPASTAYSMVNAEEMYLETGAGGASLDAPPAATLSITSLARDPAQKQLTVVLKVVNNTGHKFPSGVNLRRAFINFSVLDGGGRILWSSGRTNEQGAIVDGSGKVLDSEFTKDPEKLQPNYRLIKEQDQVQIYELRNSNETGELTTQILRLFNEVKDNRVLPQGWKPRESYTRADTYLGLSMQPVADVTAPHGGRRDMNPSGAEVTYQIDLSKLGGKPAKVVAAMEYQTTPPYYLADRFNDGEQPATGKRGTNTERLIYLASRLNTNLRLRSVAPSGPKFDVMKNWTMTISSVEQKIK